MLVRRVLTWYITNPYSPKMRALVLIRKPAHVYVKEYAYICRNEPRTTTSRSNQTFESINQCYSELTRRVGHHDRFAMGYLPVPIARRHMWWLVTDPRIESTWPRLSPASVSKMTSFLFIRIYRVNCYQILLLHPDCPSITDILLRHSSTMTPATHLLPP